MFDLKKRDILFEIYYKNLSEEEAQYFYDQLMKTDIIHVDEYLGLSNMEYSVLLGTGFKALAKWRYEGWPATCLICKQELIPEKNLWVKHDANNTIGLIHLACDQEYQDSFCQEDDEEIRYVGQLQNLRLYKWNSNCGFIDIYNFSEQHLGSFDPITGAMIRPAIKNKRMRARKKIDLLKEIHENGMSLDQAQSIITDIKNSKYAPTIGYRLGLSSQERVAFNYGVPLKELTKLRYSGLSKKCSKCNQTIDYKEPDNWFAYEEDNNWHFVHNACKPLAIYQEYYKNKCIIPQHTKIESHLDLLKELYEGRIDIEDAYETFDEITSDFHSNSLTKAQYLDIYHYCGLSEIETKADIFGVPFNVIAQWRYLGWPQRCSVCLEKIELTSQSWIPDKSHDEIYALKHASC